MFARFWDVPHCFWIGFLHLRTTFHTHLKVHLTNPGTFFWSRKTTPNNTVIINSRNRIKTFQKSDQIRSKNNPFSHQKSPGRFAQVFYVIFGHSLARSFEQTKIHWKRIPTAQFLLRSSKDRLSHRVSLMGDYPECWQSKWTEMARDTFLQMMFACLFEKFEID
jgi:hypothetical protein